MTVPDPNAPPREGDIVACSACGRVAAHARRLALCACCGRRVRVVRRLAGEGSRRRAVAGAFAPAAAVLARLVLLAVPPRRPRRRLASGVPLA